LEAKIHFETLEQEQLHYQPENPARSKHAMPADNTARPNGKGDHQPPRDNSLRHLTREDVQGEARTARKVTYLGELKAHSGSVWSVAFSPDGATIASGSNDGLVRIWEAATGRQLRQLKGHSNSVWSVAFSPDDATIASGSSDGSVWI
jgi:WD40 repeat protein